MKNWFILLFLLACPGFVFTQSAILDKKVRIETREGPVGSILDEISKQGGFIFSYGQDIPHNDYVKLAFSKQTVRQFLNEIFQGEIYCVEYGNKLLIRQKPELSEVYSVRGKVVDSETKEPLTGVTVFIPGSDPVIGSVSDREGNFQINVPTGLDVIQFSCIGYETSTFIPDQTTHADIELHPKNQELEEVVIEYYQKPFDEASNLAISYISAEKLETMPVPSIENALQGNSPGVHVVRNSGMPGSSLQVTIRGNHSLINSDPVYYLDGIPIQQTSLRAISPHDIESIEILKDASSTTEYGAIGGNGVVLLNSRRGGGDKITASFDYYIGQQRAWKTPDLMNTSEFLDYYQLVKPSDTRFDGLDSLYHTDWMELIFHHAGTEEGHFSISGGTRNSDIYFSSGYFKQSAIIKEMEFKRYSFKTGFNHRIKKRLRIGHDLAFSHLNYKGLKEGCFLNDFRNPILASMCMLPLVPPGDSGSIFISDQARMINPYDDTELANNSRKNYLFFGNILSDFLIIPDVRFETQLGFEINYQDNVSFNKSVPAIIVSSNEPVYILSNEYDIADLSFHWQNSVKYSTDFLKDHTINAMLGFEFGQCKNEWIPVRQRRYDRNMIEIEDLTGSGNTAYTEKRSATDFTYNAFSGSIRYAFRGKYYLDMVLRRDAIGFYADNELIRLSGIYPSLSLGWIFLKEYQLSPGGLLHYGKIRLGWGKAGNSPRLNYSYYAGMMQNMEYVYAFNSSRAITNSAYQRQTYEKFYWEDMDAYNLGLDLGLFRNSLFISLNYFRNHLNMGNKYKADNPLPFIGILNHRKSYGIHYLPVAEISNRGFECDLNYKKSSRNLTWEFNLNLTHLKNNIIDIEENALSHLYIGSTDPISVNIPGESAGSFFGYKIQYLFDEGDCPDGSSIVTNQPYIMDEYGVINYSQPGAQAGDYRFADVNDDGIIDKMDKTIIGNSFPDFTFGVYSYLQFLGFDLSIFFQGIYGNDIFNATKLWLYNPYGLSNWTPDITNSYRSPELSTSGEVLDEGFTSTSLHRFDYYAVNKNLRVSDFYIEDGSYIRLKNIQLGYTLKPEITKKARINRFRIFICSQNLLTFTNYSGLDPEVGGWGIDCGIYPQPRTYLAGVNLEF